MNKQINVEAHRDLPLGFARVVQERWRESIDVCGISPHHHLQLALLPPAPSSRACYPEIWNPTCFEPFGNIFLLPAQYTVHSKSDCRAQTSIVCALQPALVAEWVGGDDLQWSDQHLRQLLNIDCRRIRALMLRLAEEIRAPGFASDTLLELLVGQIIIELTRYVSGLETHDIKGGLSRWRLRLIDERLAEMGAPPTLTELAELCGLSVRHLSRAFKSSLGKSIGMHIAEQRIEQAKELIVAGMSIKAVAYTLGFSAPSNFTTAFARATGQTPRDYRSHICVTGAKPIKWQKPQ